MNKLLLCSDIIKEFLKRAILQAKVYLDVDIENTDYTIKTLGKDIVCFVFHTSERDYEIYLTESECNMRDDEYNSHIHNNIKSWLEINMLKDRHKNSV